MKLPKSLGKLITAEQLLLLLAIWCFLRSALWKYIAKYISIKYKTLSDSALVIGALLLLIYIALRRNAVSHSTKNSKKWTPMLGDLIELYSEVNSTRGTLKSLLWLIQEIVVSLCPLILQAISNKVRRLTRSNADEAFDWFGKMVDASENLLTEEDKKSLEEWDRTMVDGSGKYATSDWPGWEKYIGIPPWKRRR